MIDYNNIGNGFRNDPTKPKSIVPETLILIYLFSYLEKEIFAISVNQISFYTRYPSSVLSTTLDSLSKKEILEHE